MNETHLKILKTMHEATNRMDINMFAEAVNLTPSQTIAMVQQLATEGFLQRVGGGFGLTDKGKNSLNFVLQVPEDKTFQFYIGVNKPLGFSASSLEEFYKLTRQVCSDALEFHLYRNDFENWFRNVLDDKELADVVVALKKTALIGENLRKALLKAIDSRYGAAELI